MEYLILGTIVALLVAGYLVYQAKTVANSPYRPIQLHDGSTCENPDWPKVAKQFAAALKREGNLLGHAAYTDYVNSGKGQRGKDANTRDHYIRYGSTYPKVISPC